MLPKCRHRLQLLALFYTAGWMGCLGGTVSESTDPGISGAPEERNPDRSATGDSASEAGSGGMAGGANATVDTPVPADAAVTSTDANAVSPDDGPIPSPPPGNPEKDDCMAPPLKKSTLTEGFHQIPCTYYMQCPYKVPLSERYTYDRATNTHITWVKSNDSSFKAGNGTDPRCELRHEEEWRTGQHMFEADVWIDPLTHRTSILQHFSTNPPTSFMLTAWNDKTLRYYFGSGNGPVIMEDAFGKWFNLKILHNTATRDITVYIDDQPTKTFKHRGTHWHWKNGVYGSRTRSETRWRNMRHWVKD